MNRVEFGDCRDTMRAWAPMIGLLGRPFWAHFAYQSGGWGMGLLVAAYTVVYIRAICVNNRGRS